MNAAITWIKSNIVIVVLGVVMIAAVVGLPMYAKSRNKQVQEKVQNRYAMVSELQKLDKTSFENPVTGEVRNVAVNEALLQRYEEVVSQKKADGDKVAAEALAFNRNGHDLIVPANVRGPWLFPAPPATEAEVRPKQFHELLTHAYATLLDEIDAGSPLDPVALEADIREKEVQFRLHSLSKTAEQDLSPEDQEKLTEQLRDYRLARYEENARTMHIYADVSALPVPRWNQQVLPSLSDLFTWQWDYWIVSDILHAFASANQNAASVLDAPVKRLLGLNFTSAPSASMSNSADTGGNNSTLGGLSGGGSGGSRRPPGGSPANTGGTDEFGNSIGSGGPSGQPINPNLPTPTDYSVSFTGRTSNQLYDVVYVRVGIIADTTALPQIIDALALQNFITVLDVTFQPADPFRDAALGYLYGSPTLSQVDMLLETVWLRQWTSENMPVEMKQALGIAVPPPAPPGGAGME